MPLPFKGLMYVLLTRPTHRCRWIVIIILLFTADHRLVNSNLITEGRLQSFWWNYGWQSYGVDGFDDHDAGVVCFSLGFGSVIHWHSITLCVDFVHYRAYLHDAAWLRVTNIIYTVSQITYHRTFVHTVGKCRAISIVLYCWTQQEICNIVNIIFSPAS